MTTLATIEPTLFSYLDVPSSDRDWLQEQEEHIVSYCRRTVADHVRAGEVLLAVQRRLPGSFSGWLKEKTPLSRSTAYCLMDVARRFAELVNRMSAGRTDTIEVKALYSLASEKVPNEAREAALETAKNGTVTLADARAIIKLHRKRSNVTPSMLAKYEKVRDELFADENKAPPPAPDSRHAKAFAILEELVRETTLLGFGVVDDSEDDVDVLYFGRAHFKQDGKKPRYKSGRNLADVVEQLAGRESRKVCPRCYSKLKKDNAEAAERAAAAGEPHSPLSHEEMEIRSMRPLSWFTANRSKSDGLASECRSCSRPRIREAKKKKAA